MAVKSSKIKFVTDKVRFSFVHVFEPAETLNGSMKYSASILIPKTDKMLTDVNEFIDVNKEKINSTVDNINETVDLNAQFIRNMYPVFTNIIPVAGEYFSNTLLGKMAHGIVFLVHDFNLSGTKNDPVKAN